MEPLYEEGDLIQFGDGVYFVITPVWNDPEWVRQQENARSRDKDQTEQNRTKEREQLPAG